MNDYWRKRWTVRPRTAHPYPEPTDWRSGSPPEPGWYIATGTGNIGILRWWNGHYWSECCGVHCTDPTLIRDRASRPGIGSAPLVWLPQFWIARLWKGANP